MDGLSYQALPCPAFASNKHGCEDTRHLVNDVVYTIHGGAVSEQPVNAPASQHLLSGSELACHCGAATSPVDSEPQLLHVERLLEKIYGAVAKQLQSGGDMLTPSESNDRWREGQLRGGSQ